MGRRSSSSGKQPNIIQADAASRRGLIQALGRMKKFLANLMIAIGVLFTLSGLIGTPLVQDQLPLSFMSSSDGHQFFRIVTVEPQSPDYFSYALLLLGVTMLIAGIAFRHKLRRIAP